MIALLFPPPVPWLLCITVEQKNTIPSGFHVKNNKNKKTRFVSVELESVTEMLPPPLCTHLFAHACLRFFQMFMIEQALNYTVHLSYWIARTSMPLY